MVNMTILYVPSHQFVGLRNTYRPRRYIKFN
jgi:hypothetical protein